ncbi:UDP-N-acetylmuramate--L-alanine ligase [Sphingomonas sp.]|jgi:UDP-N-acetylmuramate--alanine ligase|uniref:UDP-N-acetylmuramate--L-alanine ligase n=1 Tax=Sphingomonas sp. TaxID=28214 RepID=UPI002D7FCE9A|nr:Mur ligase family protein [Sphingomonas sp.]HEU0045760.1 Mur ligase family protein [Sphingomonas sp.]
MVNGKRYFFVGIGGSGMMPLAMILAGRGARVEGSDRSLDAGRVAAKFDALRALGIGLHPQDGSGVTSPDQIVVASAAVEETVLDIAAAAALGCARMTRAELNAELFNAATVSIGVAGTSGKSTVTGMIGWVLHSLGHRPTVMNGAVMTNFVSPDRPFASALVGEGAYYVSEVDESDGSIALYRPSVAVLNNVSRDHKELDELRVLFGGFVERAVKVVVNVADPEATTLAARRSDVVTVAVEAGADLTARNLRPEPFAIGFDLVADEGTLFVEPLAPSLPVRLRVPGAHNVANALTALAACVAVGVPLVEAAGAIEGFTGLSRRFELIGEANGVAIIDDFGHNPDKIAATLATLRTFPGRLLLLFQPHGYGPLRQLRDELAEAFADGTVADDLLVLPDPAYFGGTVAREVGSSDLAADIRALGRDARHIVDRDAAAALLVAQAKAGDRIIVMGARDDTLGQLARRMLEQLRR